MPEIRVDPLTGLRVLVDVEHVESHEDLFTTHPDTRQVIAVPGGPPAWRAAMREHADAACLHLTATSLEDAALHVLDFVPALLARERERFGAYAVRTMGGNLLGDLVQEEVRRRERLIAYDDEAVLLEPFAPRVPGQLLLAPRTPRARYEDDGPSGDGLLAQAIDRIAGPLDLWVRTAPRGADHYCWRIEFVPRVPESAFERGTGVPLI